MCRSTKHGGRRCPGCSSNKASAKANGNRRLGREARRKVVEHLKELGLTDSAAAILAAPPSILPEFMTALGIDPAILGTTPMPSTHANPPSAGLLIAQAKAEQAQLLGPQITPEQAALEAAEEAHAAAVTAVDEARKAVNRAQTRRRKLVKEAEAAATESGGDGPSPEAEAANAAVEDATAAVAAAKQDHLDAQRLVAESADDIVAAKFAVAGTLPDEERDEYCAAMSEEDIEALARSLNRTVEAEAAGALDAGPQPALLAGAVRDTTVYKHGSFLMETGSGVVEVEGRLLDGGTAIHRRGSGDFLILQKRGDAYYGVAAAGSKSAAINKANRIPMLAELPPLHDDATDTEREAYRIKADALTSLAGEAAEHHWDTAQHQAFLDKRMSQARSKLVDSVGAGPARADIFDATKRHTKLMRERAAVAAGVKARDEALAAGASMAAAEQAYATAHRKALGTPTRGGGVIPHFDHKIPPGSLGAEKHKSLWRSGIRAWGKETAGDYAVIAQRAGNVKAWGFQTSGHGVSTSSIGELTTANAEFVKKVLNGSERAALTTYTGGSYTAINAAICGRDGVTPSGSIKTTVAGLESAFDKFREKNPNMKPMTVLRGTRVPSGWKGTPAEYLDAAFTVGSRVEMGKVTSTSTNAGTANAFAGHPPYMMVIRTRDGIPVKSISHYSGEDEVIVPTGSHLRCVHVDHKGIGGKPTVYLVAEDLVAEAEDSGGSSAWAKAS